MTKTILNLVGQLGAFMILIRGLFTIAGGEEQLGLLYTILAVSVASLMRLLTRDKEC